MSLSLSTVWTAGIITSHSLKIEDFHLAYCLRLPYRLRVGPIARFALDDDETSVLWALNRVDIPAGTTFQDVFRLRGSQKHEALFSEIIVLLNKPSMEKGYVDVVRSLLGSDTDLPRIPAKDNAYAALQAFNGFLIAYHTATGQLAGGTPLHTFTNIQFFDHMKAEVTIIYPSPVDADDEKDLMRQLFDLALNVHSASVFSGEWSDLPTSDLGKIQGALLRHQRYIFYEFAFEARSHMMQSDYIAALLYMVVAFEGAHAALLDLALRPRLADVKEKDVRGIVETLLREQGISALYRVTPYLFMDPADRPPYDILIKCQDGITLRNDIMHAKRKAKGYKIRNTTNAAISDAYVAVHEVFTYYVKAIEKLENNIQQNAAGEEELDAPS